MAEYDQQDRMKLPTHEEAVAAHEAYRRAFRANGPYPEGEAAMAKDYAAAYKYAAFVLKGRFPAGEPVIAESPVYSFQYVRDALNLIPPHSVLGGSVAWSSVVQAWRKSVGHDYI